LLDVETRRRIDTARDILVGKVPDPKSQVEQITIALIYKFMDDMDREAKELGGERKWFADGFGRYAWSELMRPGLGGQEMLTLYQEAIGKMQENPGLPQLFRDIFKNAFLPYRDPETLRAFLKIINEFEYDHSERLGDAFEYLLSVLGSQGSAGQFRTPRHIIDFIVAIVDPKKNEKVLDPACGTAGFLVSSYKHILKAHTDEYGRNTLTPDERGRLAENFRGYDISPDMVRLSLVNMYLHGFNAPNIEEYDTLTSEDNWNEYADVILANPPFMSPKGGIRPHNRFSVQSSRSEVLFVDYMAEHLTPNGRAGIIVPEGIIFQSQMAYKKLRRMLLEESLVAVVSLPAGVFKPYSGVKTSILILDRRLGKPSTTIGFFRVQADGFELGDQRRPIERNDLPLVQAEVVEYLSYLRDGRGVESFEPTFGLAIDKQRVAANGDYNLNGERHRMTGTRHSTYPLVELREICTLVRGVVYQKEDEVSEGGMQVLRANNIDKGSHALNLDEVKLVSPRGGFADEKRLKRGDIFICLASGSKDHIGKVAFIKDDTPFYFGGFMGAIRVAGGRVDPRFLFNQLKARRFNEFLVNQIAGANINNLGSDLLYRFQIPLPPLDLQREIVTEIEGYQSVINGARAVVEGYRPHIPIHPDWPLVPVVELVTEERNSIKAGPFGSSLKKDCYVPSGYKIYGQEQVIRGDAAYGDYYISEEKYRELESCKVQAGDVLISLVGTYGKTLIVPDDHEPGIINPRLLKLTLDRRTVLPAFFVHAFAQESVMSQVQAMSYGGTMDILSLKVLRNLRIPLPTVAEQEAIVRQIEAEELLVDANRQLIQHFEKKIEATLARVWGQGEPAAPVPRTP
jgi:type I restriction enzyme M protein